MPRKKEKWAQTVNTAVNSYSVTALQKQQMKYISLRYLSSSDMELGKPHVSIQAIHNNTKDMYRGMIKLRLTTGSYYLQSNRPVFNQNATNNCKT